MEEIEIMPKGKQENIILKRILRREIDKKLNDFLNMTIKILTKKRRLFNAFKQKSIKRKPRFKTVIISSLDNSNNKPLPNSTLIPILNTDTVNIIIIGTDAYYAACK